MAVSVFDVAEFILKSSGPMSTMKLQKLVYYAQAWSLVWDQDVLFHDRVEAWANGPVVPVLFERHQGRYRVEPGQIDGSPKDLNSTQSDTVIAVLGFYGDKEPQWLSDLTHAEEPWANARQGIKDGARGGNEITPEAMMNYYSSL